MLIRCVCVYIYIIDINKYLHLCQYHRDTPDTPSGVKNLIGFDASSLSTNQPCQLPLSKKPARQFPRVNGFFPNNKFGALVGMCQIFSFWTWEHLRVLKKHIKASTWLDRFLSTVPFFGGKWFKSASLACMESFWTHCHLLVLVAGTPGPRAKQPGVVWSTTTTTTRRRHPTPHL